MCNILSRRIKVSVVSYGSLQDLNSCMAKPVSHACTKKLFINQHKVIFQKDLTLLPDYQLVAILLFYKVFPKMITLLYTDCYCLKYTDYYKMWNKTGGRLHVMNWFIKCKCVGQSTRRAMWNYLFHCKIMMFVRYK